jgi:acyl-CoA thioesterase-1
MGAVLGSTGLSTGAFAQAAGAKPVILVVGDSLSAEYGLKRGEGWVPLLEKRLADQKIAATVVNASISGDTTSGGRARLAALLKQHQPTHVVLELGGNDALRGLPIQNTEDNLTQMTKAAQAAGAKVLIVGMQVPPNYGGDYLKRFEAIFQKVATTTKAAVVPFLLRGVADGPEAANLFQPDRIHPVAAAQPRMLDNVWPELKKLLER